MPQMLAALQAGKSLSFGVLTISPQGLGNGTETIPWSELHSVRLDEEKDTIKVNRQGKWLSWANVPMEKMSNILVFLALVERITGIRAEGS